MKGSNILNKIKLLSNKFMNWQNNSRQIEEINQKDYHTSYKRYENLKGYSKLNNQSKNIYLKLAKSVYGINISTS